MIKSLQKSLRQRINSMVIAPNAIIFAIHEAFSIDLIMPFLRAVGMNARLRYGSLMKEFVGGVDSLQESIQEDVFDIAQVEADEVDKFVNRPYFGSTIVQRLDLLTAGMGAQAIQIFQDGLKSGLGYKEIQNQIRQTLAVGGYKLERLVRTEGQRISNDILLATYEKNKRWIDGIMFQATLDVRTCETCAQYDRHEWWYLGTPNVAHAPYVPMHCFCRCIYTPISSAWRSEKRQRASMFGPVDKDYKEWLRGAEQNNPGFAKSILGRNYEAWRDGRYQLSAQFTPQITYANYLTQTGGIR